MLIVIKNFNETRKIKTNVYFSAIPSAFFFFYWAVCLSAIATSCELLFEVTNTAVPYVAVSDITEYRLTALEKSSFSDKDVADLVNDVCFVQRWDHQSVQAGQIVLFFFAITGLAMLIITTISGQNILR